MSELNINHANNNAARPLKGINIERVYTTKGVHPYDQVEWVRRDVIQTNWKTGEVVFEQRGVEFPSFWSMNAVTIVTTKYFRGALGSADREHSLKQLIDRVVNTYVQSGIDNDYFATSDDAAVFSDELRWMLVNQVFSFNSPVWFNVGTTSAPQISACFILAVDDTMDGILDWYKEEGLIFKGGSGAGLNLSKIRSSKELLKSSGGTASGPVSFMRGADASAGTIKSGGATRRAAKMVVLDVDHPDIEEFIETKAREEKKIKTLRDAGFEMDLGGKDIISVQYQNANNSVRVSDMFMKAVENGEPFGLTARTTGEVIETVDARTLFRKIAQAAWECADPGMQYDDTINDWHTNKNTGRITASNPCSEYLSLDNSSCNLASLNLMKFLKDDNTFDAELFRKTVEIVITAMDISICFGHFPTGKIAQTTRDYRQLGIGYANLGALLMSCGMAYDSEQGRSLAASITALMTATAYRRSAELAGAIAPYNGYIINSEPHTRVMEKHAAAMDKLVTFNNVDGELAKLASEEFTRNLELGKINGWRNAQVSLLAPTGTISFMMDSDTTGVEPDFSLVKFKKMVDGGSLQIVNAQVPRALRTLGYEESTIEAIEAHIMEHGNVVDAPGLKPEHYEVFDCAVGDRAITPEGHIHMMAAIQPFVSGAISKTVNLPETATVEDIERVYFESWKLGLKAVAVYRDNCKVGQPLSDGKAKKSTIEQDAPGKMEKEIVYVEVPTRTKLPRTRKGETVSFEVQGNEGYLSTGEYADGRLGEVFVKMSKQGSTLAGLIDAFSIAVSIGLQYGVPLETFVEKFIGTRFEPAGITDDPDIRMAQSVVDYIFRRLALDYMDSETRAAYGILTASERIASLDATHGSVPEAIVIEEEEIESIKVEEMVKSKKEENPNSSSSSISSDPPVSALESHKIKIEAPMCPSCGHNKGMRPSGSCWACECGTTTGCS